MDTNRGNAGSQKENARIKKNVRSRGVKFNETQPAELPWGLLATFSDPDGNNFSLLQPPAK
jgi:predicted enzyme related to lactoylglutathione lyase